MRSPSIDRRPRTLVGRVALAAALAAVVGGLVATLAVLLLAEAAITSAEARRLGDEAAEILVESEGLDEAAFAQAIVDEQGAMIPAGLRLAVYRGATFFGGDASLPRRPAGCATEQTQHALHYCVVEHNGWASIVAVNEVPGLGWRTQATIALGAVIVAALIGALASRLLAGWATGPLGRLGARLGDAPLDQPILLGPDEGVHEIDALRRTLRALLDRRAEALRSARLFAAGAAHELRTPLTTLSGELELLAEDALPAPAQLRIAGLRTTTARIAEMVERLLVLARVGAAEAMRHDAVELCDLLDELLQRLPEEAAARVSFTRRAPAMVRGDESLLTVLCENLVLNALRHAPLSAVEIALTEREGEVLLDVSDDGPGVAPSERARVFEPFQRGHAGEVGAGLGLALVAQIARAHGGEVTFQDTARGAHLRVRLPPWEPRGDAARSAVEPDQRCPPEVSS